MRDITKTVYFYSKTRSGGNENITKGNKIKIFDKDFPLFMLYEAH